MECSPADESSFPYFPRLSAELRIKIWRHALPGRVLRLDSELAFLQTLPPRRTQIYHVCCEARSIVEMYGFYLRIKLRSWNPTSVLTWTTWFDLSTDSIFFQVCGADTEHLLGLECEARIRAQTIPLRSGLKQVMEYKLPRSLRRHSHVYLNVPTWSLAEFVDYEGLTLMMLGLCDEFGFSDWFTSVPITWDLPADIEAEFFPDGIMTYLVDALDTRALKRLRNLCESEYSQETSSALFKLRNLSNLIDPSIRDETVREKTSILQFNWLYMKWNSLPAEEKDLLKGEVIVPSPGQLLDPEQASAIDLAVGDPKYWTYGMGPYFDRCHPWVQETIKNMPCCRYTVVVYRNLVRNSPEFVGQ